MADEEIVEFRTADGFSVYADIPHGGHQAIKRIIKPKNYNSRAYDIPWNGETKVAEFKPQHTRTYEFRGQYNKYGQRIFEECYNYDT